MDKTSNQSDAMPIVRDRERMTSLTGHRDNGASPVFIAVATAVGVGVQEMMSSGLTAGSAIGTAAGALGAYLITDSINATVPEATVIGGLAGSIGVAAGRKLDTDYFTSGTRPSPALPAFDGSQMINKLFD